MRTSSTSPRRRHECVRCRGQRPGKGSRHCVSLARRCAGRRGRRRRRVAWSRAGRAGPSGRGGGRSGAARRRSRGDPPSAAGSPPRRPARSRRSRPAAPPRTGRPSRRPRQSANTTNAISSCTSAMRTRVGTRSDERLVTITVPGFARSRNATRVPARGTAMFAASAALSSESRRAFTNAPAPPTAIDPAFSSRVSHHERTVASREARLARRPRCRRARRPTDRRETGSSSGGIEQSPRATVASPKIVCVSPTTRPGCSDELGSATSSVPPDSTQLPMAACWSSVRSSWSSTAVSKPATVGVMTTSPPSSPRVSTSALAPSGPVARGSRGSPSSGGAPAASATATNPTASRSQKTIVPRFSGQPPRARARRASGTVPHHQDRSARRRTTRRRTARWPR